MRFLSTMLLICFNLVTLDASCNGLVKETVVSDLKQFTDYQQKLISNNEFVIETFEFPILRKGATSWKIWIGNNQGPLETVRVIFDGEHVWPQGNISVEQMNKLIDPPLLELVPETQWIVEMAYFFLPVSDHYNPIENSLLTSAWVNESCGHSFLRVVEFAMTTGEFIVKPGEITLVLLQGDSFKGLTKVVRAHGQDQEVFELDNSGDTHPKALVK